MCVCLALMHTLSQVLPQHQWEDAATCTPIETQGVPSVVQGMLPRVSKRWLSIWHWAMKGRWEVSCLCGIQQSSIRISNQPFSEQYISWLRVPCSQGGQGGAELRSVSGSSSHIQISDNWCTTIQPIYPDL